MQAAPIFTCGNKITDIRDNKQYNTILIGTQCWMAANLNYGHQRTADMIQRDNCVTEKYCYNDLTSNCTTMGGLYQWDELMQYNTVAGKQGMCLPGWHIPTETEWTLLFQNYINNGFAANALKTTGYSGFKADVDGMNFFNRSWNFINFATMFWTSNSGGPFKAFAHGMNSYDPSVSLYPGSRSNAFSVRCLKD
ncbi:MAG: FISUMP domain-containing protein [Bacteroidota bacterium]